MGGAVCSRKPEGADEESATGTAPTSENAVDGREEIDTVTVGNLESDRALTMYVGKGSTVGDRKPGRALTIYAGSGSEGVTTLSRSISERRPVTRGDLDVLLDLKVNEFEYGLFVISVTHRSTVVGFFSFLGPLLTVVIRCLSILLIASMWAVPCTLFHYKAKKHFDTHPNFCPNTGTWENRLLMVSISVFYCGKLFMRGLQAGFINNDIEDEYNNDWKFYTHRRTANSRLRVWNAMDGFMYHTYDSIVYSFNLWMLFIETDPVNMVANSLVMEFVMNFDQFYRQVYLWLADHVAKYEKVEFRIVDFTRYKELDSQDQTKIEFVVYVVISVGDYVWTVFGILWCAFLLFYGPICKV